jgi:tape measure domain-containing protein
MAAQDAELKLRVSLDLGFFRQQLTGLGQAAAGYNLPVKVQFDRLSVQNELNALGANIKKRNYRLTVETNLSAEIAKADTLARKLNDLAGKIKTSTGSAFSRSSQGAAGLEKFMSEQGLSGKAFGVQQAQENIARQAILARLQKGSLSKGGYNLKGLEKIITDLGGTPTGGRTDLVVQAKKLVEESNGIADAVFNHLKDLQMQLKPIRGQAQIGAPRSASNINRILDPIAQLTQNPRAAQTMLRMMPESRITTNLLGKASQQAQYYEQVPSARGAQGLIKGFDPLLRAIADDFAAYTKSLKPGNPWLGKIGNGIGDIIANAAASPQAQKLLPAAGQTSASRMTRQMFAGLPPIQAPLIGQENAPLSSAASYMVTKARRALGLPIGPSSPLGSMGQFPMSGMMTPAHRVPTGGGIGIGGGSFIPTGGGGGGNSPVGGGVGNPPGGGGGGFGGMGGLGNFARAMGGIKLPGAGVINELGSEFAFATKQVLLFSQAYKLLAFIQDFPAQVAAAVGQLQSFRNTLDAITPSAQEFSTSNKYILSLVDQYNIPLQSARDGFTKLYASMQPAGFSGQEIRGIFEGISMGAATFGMSADKVDRVMYAFAQMASKGQVMSEELKGQLGDVLPGSLALFARAADMSLQDFGAAMEAGAFKGKTMKQLLINVGATMKEEFGKGAVGAALTFQGVMNRLATSTQLFYETFEPAAIAFANAFIVPITNGIRIVTDGFKELMTGQSAVTQGGSELAAQIRPLIPVFEGIANNAKMVAGAALNIIKALAPVVQLFLQLAASPVVGFLAQMYASVILLNGAFSLLGGKILVGLIGSLAQTAARMMALNTAAIATNASLAGSRLQLMMLASGAVQTGAAMTTLGTVVRTAVMTTMVGAVVTGVGLMVAEFFRLRGVMDSIQGRYKSLGDQARMMGESGNLAGIQRLKQAATEQANTYEQIMKGIQAAEERRPMLSKGIAVDAETAALIKRAGQGAILQGKGGILDKDLAALKQAINLNRQETKKNNVIYQDQENKARRIASELDATLNKAPLPPGEGDDKAAKKAKSDAEALAKQEQQRAIELQNQRNKLAEIGFQKELAMSDDAFEHHKSLIDAKNEYELSGLNDIQARQKKFAQDLERIELERISTVRKAQDDMLKANFEATTAAATAQAAGGAGIPSTGGSAMFGSTGNVSNAPGWVHGHFQSNTASLATLIGDVVPVVKQLLSQGVPVELSGGQKFNTNMSDSQIAALLRTGAGQHGHSGDGRSLDLFVPQGTMVPGGLADVRNTGGRGGVTGVLPGSGQSWVGHLDPRSKSGVKQSSAVFSMETKAQKETFDLQQAQASKSATQEKAALQIRNAAQLAIEKTATLIKTNIDSIYPIEQQKLENQLMKIRNDLQLQGMPSELISFEESKAKAQMEGAAALDVMNKNLATSEAKLTNYEDLIKKGAKADSTMTMEMVRLRGEIANYKAAIADMPAKQKELNIAMLEGAIAAMKNADALKAIEETSGRINDAVEGVTGTYKGLFKEIAMGADSVDALKKAQEALADQFLTMVFDFAMKPVEDFFKNSLGGIFGIPNEEQQRQKSIDAMERQLAELKEHKTILAGIERNTAAGGGVPAPSGAPSVPAPGQSMAAGVSPTEATPMGNGVWQLPVVPEITQSSTSYSAGLEAVKTATSSAAVSVGESAKEISAEGPAGAQWQKALGQVVGGIGLAAGSIMGIAAGINQIKEGGTSNVLGGIGTIASMAGSLLGGFSSLGGLFSGGAPAPNMGGKNYFNPQTGKGVAGPNFGLANGGIMHGGFMPFRAFANGGIVTGPTMGLVGEGKYSEAVVPLPNGKSIPVQFSGERSARDMMSRSAQSTAQASPINLSFETTKIGNTEYVSRDQLEAAMAETRRSAISGGAARGMSMTLDRIQQSPSVRSRIGIR